jgi:hypothetical protein
MEDIWFYHFDIIIIHENVCQFIQIHKISTTKCGYAVVVNADNRSISTDAAWYGYEGRIPASGLLEAACAFTGTCSHCSDM